MAFDYSAARTAIHNHLVAVGTALTPPVKHVARGAAASVTEPQIRSWYTGDGASELIPDTLTDGTGTERVAIALYWPLGDAGVVTVFDVVARTFVAQARNRLLGNGKLGGASQLTVGDFSVEFVETTGGLVGVVGTEVGLHFTDVDSLS